MLVLTVDGDELKVPYDPSHEADFVRLHDALTDTGAAEVTPSSGAPPAGAKTCPMCAEDVKAAALVCRFCGHRFDEQ